MDALEPMNVLVSLHRGYGLGDGVAMSAVLQHICKYRPNWTVDYQAQEGQHQVGRGIVANTFAYGTPYPRDHYDAEVQLVLYDRWYGWTDRPNTRVASCLHECLGLPWDAECGRYRVDVSARATYEALSYMRHTFNPGSRFIGIHTEGRTAKDKKDLTPMQGEEICDAIRRCGRIPFSFNNRSGDSEANCALIRQCEAFVGIDSGPAKCASATDTPSLVVWTGHHPAAFHDPAINTTHLVPIGYHCLAPVKFDEGVTDWFERHHNIMYYIGDPVDVAVEWLRGVLK